MVRKLASMKELSMETVFIDGTKLEACANKYTFVWKKSVGKWEEKMFLKIQDAVQMINLTYMKSFQIEKETRTPNLQEIMEFLSQYCTEHKIPFVNGVEKEKASISVTMRCSAAS